MNKRVISIILIILFSLSLIYAPSMVYAHNRLSIYEDNEQSNCGEEWEYNFWEGVPSLSIEKIECSPDNKLSVIIVLQPARINNGPWQNIWEEAEGKVYFDGEEMGVFDIGNPTYPEDGIDSYSYGRYTYLLPWEITAPVMVKVIIHATTVVEVSEWWRGYPSRHIIEQELVEPLVNTPTNPSNTLTTPGTTSVTPGNTSTNGAIYIPLLLGFFGLSLVIWIGYKRYGTRLFCRRRKS